MSLVLSFATLLFRRSAKEFRECCSVEILLAAPFCSLLLALESREVVSAPLLLLRRGHRLRRRVKPRREGRLRSWERENTRRTERHERRGQGSRERRRTEAGAERRRNPLGRGLPSWELPPASDQTPHTRRRRCIRTRGKAGLPIRAAEVGLEAVRPPSRHRLRDDAWNLLEDLPIELDRA